MTGKIPVRENISQVLWFLQICKIIEFRFKGTFEDHLVQPPSSYQG